jgi:hypothetical protein
MGLRLVHVGLNVTDRGPDLRHCPLRGPLGALFCVLAMLVSSLGVMTSARAGVVGFGSSSTSVSPGISATTAEWSRDLGVDDGQPANNVFHDVACTSSSSCVAVGWSASSAPEAAALAERWNGVTWKVMRLTLPPRTVESAIQAIACNGSSHCLAVGSGIHQDGTSFALAERWNGVSWKLTHITVPPGGVDVALEGVECAGPTRCTAVGSYRDSSEGKLRALVEGWSEGGWHVVPVPHDRSAEGESLDGVTCPTRHTCTAVGSIQNASNMLTPLVERWDGSAWARAPSASAIGWEDSVLSDVVCRTDSDCSAVGYEFDPGKILALGEHWDGNTWKVIPTLGPPGALTSDLNGVACPRARDCLAVGYDTTSSFTGYALAEHWNGATWTTMPADARMHAIPGVLSQLSCSGPHDCMAVGFEDVATTGTTEALAVHWDGARWSVTTTPTERELGTYRPVSR